MQEFLVVRDEECAACGKMFKAMNFNYHACFQGVRCHAAYYCDECIRRGVVCPHCGELVTKGDGCMISSAKSQQIRSAGVAWESEPIQGFSKNALDAIGHYVYALVDPRNNEIFYVGKGSGTRIYDHARESIAPLKAKPSKKTERIRSIICDRQTVGYYILRHNLTEQEAYIVESTIIDLLTYTRFNLNYCSMTNIIKGHHQWDDGIKTFGEICRLYDCDKIEPVEGERLLLVSLNRTYKPGQASLYDCARGNWRLDKKRAAKIDYILGVYKGIVRVVIKVERHAVITEGKDAGRSIFEGSVVEDSPYLNKDVSDYPFGRGGSVTYIPRIKREKKEV